MSEGGRRRDTGRAHPELRLASEGALGDDFKKVSLRQDYFNRLGRGQITHDDKVWTYYGHGAGLTFEGDGNVVNVHIVPWLMDVVDAWRLYVYLDDKGITAVAHAEKDHIVEDQHSVSDLLEHLVEQGTLVPVGLEGVTHKLYRLAQGSGAREEW